MKKYTRKYSIYGSIGLDLKYHTNESSDKYTTTKEILKEIKCALDSNLDQIVVVIQKRDPKSSQPQNDVKSPQEIRDKLYDLTNLLEEENDPFTKANLITQKNSLLWCINHKWSDGK